MKKELNMTTNNVQEALQMINSHDWYWMMADYGYIENSRSAEAHMRRFVAMVATINNAVVREALRNLWKLHYEHAHNSINGKETENYEGRRNELMEIVLAC